LGKIARDITLLAQTEIGEAREGLSGGSSTMPQKQNPVNSAIALASAVRAPGLVAAVLAAMPQEHERGLGGWQAEWDTIPDLVGVTADAAEAIAESVENLVVDPARMRANLDSTGGLILAEAVAMRLAPRLGKQQAHVLVEDAARRVVRNGRGFADVLAEDPQISSVLDRAAIDEALSPEKYLGSAAAFIAEVLARHDRVSTGR
jgi:3-carboxy-cis,cis-muconate cycloisomerase